MKFSITKFHENPPSGSRADTRGRTDRHDKGNRRFPRISDLAKNWILKKWVGKCWVLPFGSGYGKIAGCFEDCNEPSYPQNAGIYLTG
jgi:hypothetical protein